MSNEKTPKKTSKKEEFKGISISELGFGNPEDWEIDMLKDAIPIDETFLIVAIREGKSQFGRYAVLTIKRIDGTVKDYNTKSKNTLVNQSLGYMDEDGKEVKGFIHHIESVLAKSEGIVTKLKTSSAKLGDYYYFA